MTGSETLIQALNSDVTEAYGDAHQICLQKLRAHGVTRPFGLGPWIDIDAMLAAASELRLRQPS